MVIELRSDGEHVFGTDVRIDVEQFSSDSVGPHRSLSYGTSIRLWEVRLSRENRKTAVGIPILRATHIGISAAGP